MNYITEKEALLIEIKELEKLIKIYDTAIEKGGKVNIKMLNIAESEYLDKTINAMHRVEYSDAWIKYTNNLILSAMAKEIRGIECPDYTRYYGVRSENATH